MDFMDFHGCSLILIDFNLRGAPVRRNWNNIQAQMYTTYDVSGVGLGVVVGCAEQKEYVS